MSSVAIAPRAGGSVKVEGNRKGQLFLFAEVIYHAPQRGGSVSRMPWLEYFMNITYLVAERSTCLRRRVGAIAVRDKRILATGYNGAPASMPHCAETGCLREELQIPSGQRHEICRGLHAEQNVIIQAALHSTQIRNALVYCTTHPCVTCTKMLINCSISAIYYAEDYPDPLAVQLLREAGIHSEQLNISRSPR